MKRIPATKFKRQCLAMLDRLTPEGIVITRHGRPIARLLSMGGASEALIGSLRRRIEVKGDLLSTDLHWDVER